MDCNLDRATIAKIKEIESLAYPPHMRMYTDFETPEDVEDYADCDGRPFCHVDDGWYMLGCEDPGGIYVADLASSRSLGFTEVNKVIGILRGFGNRTITASCRQSTSYRLLQLMAKRGVIEIIQDRSGQNWGGETMREVEFKVRPQGFKEWLTISEALDPKVKDRLEKVSEKIFPDREALKSLIDDMERDPRVIPPGEAFQRIDRASRGGAVAPRVQQDAVLDKLSKMLPRQTPAIAEFVRMYESKRMKAPELMSLAFFAANGADDRSLRTLAEEMQGLPEEWRARIMFPRNKPQINTVNGNVEFDDIGRFSSAVHSLMGQSADFSNKAEFDPKTDIRPERQRDLVAEGGGIWIYKGTDPTMCRLYGKGSTWCIASSTSTQHYFNYRIEHGQMQYFVFDTNKSKDDPARKTNPGVAAPGEYSEWVDMRNTHAQDPETDYDTGFGINGYSSINDYKKYLAGKLGMTVEKLDQVMKPEPVTDEEKRLHRYLKDYEEAT